MISHDLQDFSRFKSILCLNGNLPNSGTLLKLNLPIIAADGAANKLFRMGVFPTLVIGDMDGISRDLLKKIPHIKDIDQDYSDFQKAISYISSNNLAPSIICGLSGGFLDHILNNVNIFSELENSIFMDDEILGLCARTSCSLELCPGTKVSIFGLPECRISTTGLKWELENETLTFPGKNSSLNRVRAQQVDFNISHGTAFIIIYKNIIKDAGY